jgi:hypothetical protein
MAVTRPILPLLQSGGNAANDSLQGTESVISAA